VTSIPDATIKAYFEAWNEPNDAARLKLLEVAWADDGVLRDVGSEVVGREAVSDYIGQALRAVPGRVLVPGAVLEGPGGRRGVGWTLRLPDGTTHSGYFVGEVDAAGRLTLSDVYGDPALEPREPSLWSKLRAGMVANPIPTAGLVLAAIYVVLRLQAERFYTDFAVTPEDAGFGALDLAVRQSSYVLLTFAVIGILWSALYFVGMYPTFAITIIRSLIGRTARKWEPFLAFGLSMASLAALTYGVDNDWRIAAAGIAGGIACLYLPRMIPNAEAARAEARRRLLAWSRLVVIVGTLGFGLLTFAWTGWDNAKQDADAVRAGGTATATQFPWRARRVTVVPESNAKALGLPGCEKLVYLGENGDRVVLFDQVQKRTVRVESGDVQLVFPESC
jgi:hypothetical protein